MKLSSRIRTGVAVAALGTLGIASPTAAAGPAHPPLTGPYCSGGVGISGPGSTAQINAVPGFDGRLQGGGESDLLNNVVPGCGTESVTDTGGGSGAGINSQISRSAPIAFSDDPLSVANQALVTADGGVKASPVHTIPIAVLPVSVIVNLACYTGNLKLSSIELAKMYDGVIKTWDNTVLNVDNPGIKTSCAGQSINLVARADVSGTTFLFKSYLAHQNPEYQALKQDALNTTWAGHIACRGSGTGGVIGCVGGTPNSVGYAASSNARNAGMREARVDNGAHTFSTWSPGACSLAALTAPIPPSTLLNWSLTDFTDSPVGYGICGYTYDFVLALQKTALGGVSSRAVTQTIVDYITAAASAFGQDSLPSNQYDKLPVTTEKLSQAAPYMIAYI